LKLPKSLMISTPTVFNKIDGLFYKKTFTVHHLLVVVNLPIEENLLL
jgi:hypothetical protein